MTEPEIRQRLTAVAARMQLLLDPSQTRHMTSDAVTAEIVALRAERASLLALWEELAPLANG